MAAVLGTAGYFGLSGSRSAVETVRHSCTMMGTIVNIAVCCQDRAPCQEAIDNAIGRMESLSSMFSTYIPDSPLSQLNRDGIIENAPAELIETFELSRNLSEITDGAFDPTIMPLLTLYRKVKQSGTLPPRRQIEECLALVDYRTIIVEDHRRIRYTKPGVTATLDGIAKGYIVDQGMKHLKAAGFANAYVEAGGDLITSGTRADGKPWRIGIRNPRSGDLKQMATISLSDRAIATSGDYMHYFTDDKKAHHIINPKTGFSPVNTASSSILAPTVATADGLATATMVMGPEAAVKLVESLPDCEGYFFDKQIQSYQTSRFFS